MKKNLFPLISLSLLMTAGAFGQATGTSGSTAATTSASTTAKKPPIFRPTKEQIKQVQTILKDKKLYTGEANGTYNDDTRAGIKSFQKDNGLKETGTLNRATLEKFGVALTDKQKLIPVSQSSFAVAASSEGTRGGKTTTATASTPIQTQTVPKTATASTATTTASSSAAPAPSTEGKKPAPFRANADQIKAAQKILRDGKMLTGGEDGKLDDPTREGLGKYQEANSLKITKTLNAATLEKMAIALTDAQKANVAAQAAYDAAKPKN